MTAYYFPTADNLIRYMKGRPAIWKIYSIRVALRYNAKQLPVFMWTDPPYYTRHIQILPPKYIPIAAFTPEMAIDICRAKHPSLLVINVTQS